MHKDTWKEDEEEKDEDDDEDEVMEREECDDKLGRVTDNG